MTIAECIALVDGLKPNSYSEAIKIGWLNQVDKKIITEVLSNSKLSDEEFLQYNLWQGHGSAMDTLHAPDPYSELYRWWMEAQIDLANMETNKYNNSMMLYTKAYKDFANYWNRTHITVSDVTHYRL